ncbi:glycosyltransferase family 4 protein [Rhodopseudomonas palustris]|uniref:glycosyltransferase family 4 protein n=1 Tax=Rhodopseudomonas palustris TaxID=1076 RepID=UPI0018DB8465|nr:glycosyltransferase family 4 protein [Rhodopseudomonas palustris]
MRYTYELVRELQKDPGLRLHLSLSKQGDIFPDLDGLGLPGFHIDTYNSIPTALLSLARLPLIRAQFWKYVREHDISVVVCTMSHLWDVPVLWRKPKDVVYLLVLHDALPHAGDDVAIRKRMLDSEIASSDGIIALTENTRKLVTEMSGYPRDRVWVIPLGVFPYAVRGVSAQARTDAPLQLLFFGRLLPYKGLDLLLEAYRLLKGEGKNIALRIAGPGDIVQYRAQLDGLADVSIDNRWIPEEEVGAVFEDIDIVVAPYRGASQSGVLATSGAAGIPAVVTPVGGLAEQVLHEQTGIVAADTSPAAIAAALGRLIDDDELRSRCAEGAKRHATEVLAWSAIAAQFSPILKTISSRRRAGPT